jgi:transposase InsO family protein
MPWREVSAVDERRELVRLAMLEGANRRELCRRFGISADVAYKWLGRWQAGDEALVERSRRPHRSPSKSTAEVEARVLAARASHPAWGARKLRRWLADQGVAVPAPSTVHEILRRHGRIDPLSSSAERAHLRFERPAPNDLWQMDFKGWVTLTGGQRCHPLTIVDDHSRFVPCLKACADQQGETVRGHLESSFHRYGLPEAIFVDNGSPWGDASGERWTWLGVWLLKLGVDLIYARPYHPQSRGKNERFHRSLKAEVFALQRFASFSDVQRAFDAWREVYNFERPHEALDLAAPASRYRPSARPMPRKTPTVDYDMGETLRTVSSTKAYISFKGQLWKVPQAFRGERVAVRPLSQDGRYGVFFASRKIATINLTNHQPVSDVSEQVSAMSPV